MTCLSLALALGVSPASAAPPVSLEIVDETPVVVPVQHPEIDIILTRIDTRPSYAWELQQSFLDRSVGDVEILEGNEAPVAAPVSSGDAR